jgi:purine-binding chemotaxis protein CheW
MEAPHAAETSREFLTFRLAAEEYAIDILQVREIRAYETPTRIANTPTYVKGVVNLRGAIVPILDLRERFGLGELAAGASRVVVILSLEGRPLGIVVDAVSDVVRLQAGDIRPAPEQIRAVVSEAFVHGLVPVDDRMLIVVDLARVVAVEAYVEVA